MRFSLDKWKNINIEYSKKRFQGIPHDGFIGGCTRVNGRSGSKGRISKLLGY